MNGPFILRRATELDVAFIVDSWLKSYEWHPSSREQGKRYVHEMKWLIKRLLLVVPVVVACLESDPETIVGYVVATNRPPHVLANGAVDKMGALSTVHYVFVKKDFRRLGVAKALLAPFLERSDVIYTSRPKDNVTLPKGWTYAPMGNVRALVE